MTKPLVRYRHADVGGEIGTAPTVPHDEASLREVARRHFDDEASGIGDIVDAERPLTADERAGLIAVIQRIDGLDPVELAREHDVVLAGVALGSWRRERRAAEQHAERARRDATRKAAK